MESNAATGALTVRVIALGSAAPLLGWEERAHAIAEGQTLAALIGQVESAAPRFRDVRARVRFAVNQRYAREDCRLRDGDEVAIIPPVSGG